ncbi:putative baseplate protein [Paenibacillus sp. TCA20]|uniref:hypothetical protein n=1 Tax=Paenibacillus sp. TCA20 TaxID=1499968 RepID=UPI0004D45352|nr:hypothetical protein [Paenibacillus sp. TCA20]GAK42061.1 putative baseplate protein [Paenibacillus sp. TCA20]
MALIKRTANEILSDAMTILSRNTPITNYKPGAIARSLLESMKDEFPNLYDFAEETLNMGFLSKADDEYLDLIGALFSYPRRMVETVNSDGSITTAPLDKETYRYEISQQVLVAASGNYAALRLIILTVPGVADCIGKEYTHGTGSFSFTIIPQYGFSLSQIMAGVEDAIDKTKCFGIRPNIVFPASVNLELRLQISFSDLATTSEREQIRISLRGELIKYFGNFDLGQGFVYNDFVQQVMDIDRKVADFTVQKFYLNDEPALLTNQSILEDELLTPIDIVIE